jgi:hypothetical protein
MMDDLSVFYYTYSTIAQTLGGAFGFLVAVALYRLQAIKAGMPKLEDEVRAKVAILEVEHVTLTTVKEKLIAAQRGRITAAEAQMGRIRKGLLLSLIATSITIALCFVLMPLTGLDRLPSVLMTQILMWAVVAFALICLIWYCVLARALVAGEAPQPPET